MSTVTGTLWAELTAALIGTPTDDWREQYAIIHNRRVALGINPDDGYLEGVEPTYVFPGWIGVDTRTHTCGAGEAPWGHERYCGVEPVMPTDTTVGSIMVAAVNAAVADAAAQWSARNV